MLSIRRLRCGGCLGTRTADSDRIGHDRRAGGFIPLPSTSPSAIEDAQSELRRRLLRALKIEETRGRRLVPRREMLQNLSP